MRSFSHLNAASTILSAYSGEEPFHLFLKTYFRAHPKHGSRDRRLISQLCYGFFRLGKAAQSLSIEAQILAGYFLCASVPTDFLQEQKPDWNERTHLSIDEKMAYIGEDLRLEAVFPWQNQLSKEIEMGLFVRSFFQQPLLFLRVRPGNHERVKELLRSTAHEWIGGDTVAVDNTTSIKDLLAINKEVVIQDRSSQAVGAVMGEAILPPTPKIWDCCAASGGKSILAMDVFPQCKLTVSDIRSSILSNLKSRLKEAGILQYHSSVIDLTAADAVLPNTTFDLVIADVPCSGSGTWGRTPEQLYYFDAEKIDHYADLQSRILQRVAEKVKPGGYLLYCTCSVFKAENEDQVANWKDAMGWTLEKELLIKGYDHRADTLYTALLRKEL